jgi:hypothetical protein
LTAKEVTEHETPPECIVHGAAAVQWLCHSRLTILSLSLSLSLCLQKELTITWVSALIKGHSTKQKAPVMFLTEMETIAAEAKGLTTANFSV